MQFHKLQTLTKNFAQIYREQNKEKSIFVALLLNDYISMRILAAEVGRHYFEQHTWAEEKRSVSLNQSWTTLAKKQCTMVTIILNKNSLRQERPSLRWV